MELASWKDGKIKTEMLQFLEKISDVPEEDRIAVFDNDGTLWCEKPVPIQTGFFLRRIGEMLKEDFSLKDKQPWKAVAEKDNVWLENVITKHYQGDDSDLKEMMKGLLQAYQGFTVEEYAVLAEQFLKEEKHPHFKRPFIECIYQPMRDLLDLLEDKGFTNYIVSGGGRDFVRAVSGHIYGIPPERVIGSSVGISYEEREDHAELVHQPELDIFDDGPIKPVRIWSRIGKRPIFCAGNSNGDIQMMKYCEHPIYPWMNILIDHDDNMREYAYNKQAEESLAVAAKRGWKRVSMKQDWATVFNADLVYWLGLASG